MNQKTAEKNVFDREDQVASFLRRHPDFLERHEELLEDLTIPHGISGASSFLTYQVRKLREANRSLKQQHRKLTDIAVENERLYTRLHKLSVDLLLESDLESMLTKLGGRLRGEFSADEIVLWLWESLPAREKLPEGTGIHVIASEDLDETWARIKEDCASGRPVCGNISTRKRAAVFPREEGVPPSVLLIPLKGQTSVGVLAIASQLENRYPAEMDTSILHHFARLFGIALERFTRALE